MFRVTWIGPGPHFSVKTYRNMFTSLPEFFPFPFSLNTSYLPVRTLLPKDIDRKCTYFCSPKLAVLWFVWQYDFPTQDTVIRFVIEAIQAEMFNADTLFLIGTYTIGKALFLLCAHFSDQCFTSPLSP